jgi:hypothetical protein
MTQAKPVLFDFHELLVKRQSFRGLSRTRRRQLTLRMRQNFFEMTGDGHCGDDKLLNRYTVTPD